MDEEEEKEAGQSTRAEKEGMQTQGGIMAKQWLDIPAWFWVRLRQV